MYVLAFEIHFQHYAYYVPISFYLYNDEPFFFRKWGSSVERLHNQLHNFTIKYLSVLSIFILKRVINKNISLNYHTKQFIIFNI